LSGSASTRGLSDAELLLASIAYTCGNQSDSKNDEQRQKHAQIANRHDESYGGSGQGPAEIHAAGEPGQHGESCCDGQSSEESVAAEREFKVMQRCEDSKNRGGKAQRQEVRDPE
jgi:hypothetical protein